MKTPHHIVLEQLAQAMNTNPHNIIGSMLPGAGVVLSVTWDEVEGAVVWFRDEHGSTRVFCWDDLDEDSSPTLVG